MQFFRTFMNGFQHPRFQSTATPWPLDAPSKQPFFTFNHNANRWTGSNGPRWFKSNPHKHTSLALTHPALTVITWNIDFTKPLENERMSAALSYLENYISTTIPTRNAIIILFQEMTQSDLTLIQSTRWIQQNFHITDVNTRNWHETRYGTCTLIDKRLHLKQVFRVHYRATHMGRDALFVDVAFPSPPSHHFTHHHQQLHRPRQKTLRICNVHLESMRRDPPLRPLQLSTAARFMHDPHMHASILAGDLNAIQPFDRTLHADNHLRDAYRVLGGKEGGEEGHTWGYMSRPEQRARHGCTRLDKVLYTGRGLWINGLERIGWGLEIRDRQKREWLKQDSGCEKGWLTDHLGLRADFEVREY